MKVVTELSCDSLRKLESEAEPKNLKRRILIVRLAKAGFTGNEIASLVSLSRRRVQSWVSRFNRLGIEGLRTTRSG